MLDLPLSSLVIILPGHHPITYTSNNQHQNLIAGNNNNNNNPSININSNHHQLNPSHSSSPSTTLSQHVLNCILKMVPNVCILPCGLSFIVSNPPAYTLFLIDLDSTTAASCQSCSPASQPCPHGSALLSRIKSSKCRNIVPLVMSSAWSPKKVREALLLGAIDYLPKPLSIATARFLWLNLFRFRLALEPNLAKQLPTFKLAPTSYIKPALAWENCLESAVAEFYTPSSPLPTSLDYCRFTTTPFRSNQLLRTIRRKNFNPYLFGEDELLIVCQLLIQQVFGYLNIRVCLKKLQKFILICQVSYLNNHYHNFYHAVDVLQATYLYLIAMGLPQWRHGAVGCSIKRLSAPHIVALTVSALGHDLGHPGVNNAFLVKKGVPLAVLYNDTAVLESFHTISLINLLHLNDCVFFDNVFESVDHMHRLFASVILSTDMSAHFDYIKQICSTKEQLLHGSFSTEDVSLTILSALIKCSDLINVTRPFDIAQTWTQCLTDELIQQCKLELKLGMTPLISLEKLTGPQYSSQVSFLSSFALPLFESTVSLIPELGLFARSLKENLKSWRKLDVMSSPRPSIMNSIGAVGSINLSNVNSPNAGSGRSSASAPPRLESPGSPEPCSASSLSPRQSIHTLVAESR